MKHSNDWRIRGITRSLGSEKTKAWAAKGVEIVQGDQNNTETLKEAFSGANAIFSVTDYGASYAKVTEDEASQAKVAAAGKTINDYAADLEISQGIDVATAASDPKVLGTLEHFVLSTLTGIKTVSGGKYAHPSQFDSKASIEKHIREQIPELSKRMSTVNMGTYQENWRDLPLFGPLREQDGTFSFMCLKSPEGMSRTQK